MKLATFWDVLFKSGKLEKEISFEELRESASVSRAIEKARSVDRAAVWKAFSGSLSDRVEKLLSQPVEKQIVGAFAAYKDLLQYTDSKTYPPEKEVFKSYGKRSLEVGIKPRLELYVDGALISKLHLWAKLALEVKTIVLTICGGRIRRMSVGEVDATGSFHIEEVKVYEMPEVRTFDGFRWKLGEGIPIAPWKEEVAAEVATHA